MNKQLLIYGSPGTGKSYFAREFIDNQFDENTVRIYNVTFHPTFSYSDFIGSIKPSLEGDPINYQFIPGPFTSAYVEAVKDENSSVFLIIDEFNRGDVSSIFGDIFQLLDRNSYGISEYSIINEQITNYLDEKHSVYKSHICLPSNFYIIGTMNSTDQNVFTLDTAFKRRFKMYYKEISYDENKYTNKINFLSEVNVFDGESNWMEFLEQLNELIENLSLENNMVNTESKLGPYFIDEIDVASKKNFFDKIYYYLKEDLFKYTNILNENDEYYLESFIEGNNLVDIIKGESI